MEITQTLSVERFILIPPAGDEQVVEADKAMVRLREVFKERAAAFREAVQLLFGYRCVCT